MGRLKGVSPLLSPDLLHAIASMGHGDEIVFADANFPASSTANCGPRLVDSSGHDICSLLKAVLQFFPVDSYAPDAVIIMDRVDSDKKRNLPVPVWDDYAAIVRECEGRKVDLNKMDRFAFYERAKKAFAVVATGETALYGNIILKKGVVE